ncbi:MAG TPA: outer membrane beta-barrel protein [Candidatus Acidoferrum sp.]|nr:outer membrane beta-barrel protein [Candidatus Acidoferrum sp.]
MKKVILLSLAFALLISATASPQGALPVPFSIYGGGFMSFPSSPSGFKDAYKNGFHALVGLGFKTAPMAQLVPTVEYHHFGRDYSFGNLTGVDGGSLGIWLYGVNLRIAPNFPASPIGIFGIAGIGLSRLTYAKFTGINSSLVDDLNRNLPGDDSKFYYNVGAGLTFKFLPSIDLFAMVRYVSISTSGQSSKLIPFTVGLKIF